MIKQFLAQLSVVACACLLPLFAKSQERTQRGIAYTKTSFTPVESRFGKQIAITRTEEACATCKERTAVGFDKIEWLGIQKPDDPVLLEQYEKLNHLWAEITYQFDQLNKNNCVFMRQTGKGTQNQDVVNFNYRMFGIIIQSSSDYILKIWIQPACSNKKLGEREVRFQLYPVMDLDRVSREAATHMISLINSIEDFETKERISGNLGLGGDIWGGRISITMNNKMAKGEEVRVVMKVVDCDGMILSNKEISTEGTSGGVFTPAKFKTNSEGNAVVKFRMTTDKTAIVKASCETKNVWGCQDLYTGTEAVKGIEGAPVKVEITYHENRYGTLQHLTLPGVEIQGGKDNKATYMDHKSVFYHFPSQKALKEGFLIDASKKNGEDEGKTIYVVEKGLFSHEEKTGQYTMYTTGPIKVEGHEGGQEISYFGSASLDHPSEVLFHKGNVHQPPTFMWTIEYPASGEGIAVGTATLSKDDTTVSWKERKITDPKSIYKTEYLLTQTLNLAKEFEKGNNAMRQMFGINLDNLQEVIDPTNPRPNIASETGTVTIKVRILSPY